MLADMKLIQRQSGLSRIAKDYLDVIVDCSDKKAVGVPTLIGGAPGRTSVGKYKQEIAVTVGQTGYGYLSCNYADVVQGGVLTGPFQDTPVFSYTSASYTGNTIGQRGTAISGTGVVQHGWRASTLSASVYNNGPNALQYRLVGALIEITNTTAVLDQNGTITLFEPQNHVPLNGTTIYDLTLIESERTSRVVRAQNSGSATDKVALNWHPKALEMNIVGADANDFDFKTSGSTPSSQLGFFPAAKEAIVVFKSQPGDTFHITVNAVYEMKGFSVQTLKPRLVDPVGMAMIFNTLAYKSLDGYEGNPRRVADGYMARLWESAKKVGGWFKEHERDIRDGTAAAVKAIAGFI